MTRFFLYLLAITMFSACKNQEVSLSEIRGKEITISDSLQANQAINNFIAPYKKNIDKQMDSVLAYAPKSLSKSDGAYNTAIGNMLADAVFELEGPIFKQRTNSNIDAVLLNHGGIRSTLNQGSVTMRSAYEIMPFENMIVVVELTGKKVNEMFQYLKSGKAHPLSGIQLVLNDKGDIETATIGGAQVDENKTYFIATSDYLQQGGDRMDFFKDPVSIQETDYKLRNLLIDYFAKHDTIAPVRDNRFIKIQ
ncbi:5'-nucleotidase C-terminal domain-containing protein [Leeuwenhoekiella sp. A16]|uniref:5'-nucleotidase C-terminal domain-containing protein n=1 Tax=unclassified Leeuwenhoekiella TaxID=2615029 RepID=UPI003A80CA12